jgi:hypothetical protein
MDTVARRGGLHFVPGRDVYDVNSPEGRGQPPPLSLVFDYDTVVLCVVNSTRGSALRDVATFFDPYVERNRNRVARFNYLNLFVENGGHLWVCGAQPAHVLWPTGDRPLNQQLPVDVVNWDDYTQPHPQVDSVGVASLLYKLGVEGFDLGSGGRAPPPRMDWLDQACLGFRLASSVQIHGAPQLLEPDGLWAQPQDRNLNPMRGRPNIEIYDMPGWMDSHFPPLRPPSNLVLAPYLYASGVPQASQPDAFYPMTADAQPVVVLRRAVPDTPYSRAICGFEPWLLRPESHLGLADFIILRCMERDRTP